MSGTEVGCDSGKEEARQRVAEVEGHAAEAQDRRADMGIRPFVEVVGCEELEQ